MIFFKRHLTRFVIAIFAIGIFAFACGTNFEDDSVAVVKKISVLSIVLEPPEATPGEPVTASFLMADKNGTYMPPMLVWTVSEGSDFSLVSSGVDDGNINVSGSDPAQGEQNEDTIPAPDKIGLMPVHPFIAEAKLDEDDKSSLKSQSVILISGKEKIDLSKINPEDFGLQLEEMLATGEVLTSMRTLIISRREERNQNPVIKKLEVGRNENEPGDFIPLDFVSSTDLKEQAEKREQAMTNAYVLEICETEQNFEQPSSYCSPFDIYFDVTVSDDDDISEAIRYQWISIAGDFGGHRDKLQSWTPPCYLTDADQQASGSDGDNDLEGESIMRDANLYPVYLIVRDNGIDNNLGQSWAEFYVRLKLVDCD